jgi:energy-coupling factor transporter transmembrane protein EcfT
MELRAFGYQKTRTYLRSIQFTWADWAASALLIVAGLTYLVWYWQTF